MLALTKKYLPPGGRGTAAGFPETRLRVFGVRANAVEGERAIILNRKHHQELLNTNIRHS